MSTRTVPRSRQGTGYVTWAGPMPLAQAGRRSPTAHGVYIVEQNGRPVYVGMSRTFSTRLPRHLRRFGSAGVQVRFGMIESPTEQLRRAVEHSVIRELMRSGYHLRNRQSVRPLQVPGGTSLQVFHYGSRPTYLPRQRVIEGGRQFEH